MTVVEFTLGDELLVKREQNYLYKKTDVPVR
jgi:hypothetical protein